MSSNVHIPHSQLPEVSLVLPSQTGMARFLLNNVLPTKTPLRSKLIDELVVEYSYKNDQIFSQAIQYVTSLIKPDAVKAHVNVKELRALCTQFKSKKVNALRWPLACQIYYLMRHPQMYVAQKACTPQDLNSPLLQHQPTVSGAEEILPPPPPPPPKRSPCTICDCDYTVAHMCPDCRSIAWAIKRIPGYHSGKFKNDAQAVRRFRDLRDPKLFVTYLNRKKDYAPRIQRPKLPPQPPRDFDLQQLEADPAMRYLPPSLAEHITRQMRRMQQFLEEKSSVIEPHGATINDMIRGALDLVVKAIQSGVVPYLIGFIVASVLTFTIATLLFTYLPREVAIALVMVIPALLGIAVMSLSDHIQRVVDAIVNTLKRLSEKHAILAEIEINDQKITDLKAQMARDSSELTAKPVSTNPFDPIVPHGFLDTLRDGVALLRETFSEVGIVSAEVAGVITGKGSNVAASSMSLLHVAALTIRDFRTVAENAQPLIEGLVGFIYESVFDLPWVPWSQRGITARIEAMMVRYREIQSDVNRASHMHIDGSYQVKTTLLIKDFQALEKELTEMRMPPRYLQQVTGCRHDLEKWKMELLAAAQVAHDRAAPVCVEMRGPPGSGKSTCARQLYTDIFPVIHELYPDKYPAKYTDASRFSKKVTDERWDGYIGQPIVELDDLWLRKDDASRIRDSSIIIATVNTAAFSPDMSALENKGTVHFDSVLVVVSHMNPREIPNLGVVNANGVYRRLHVRLEFQHGNDLSKPETWQIMHHIMQPDGTYTKQSVRYPDLVATVAGLLRAHHAMANNSVTPISADLVGKVSSQDAAQYLRNIVLGASKRHTAESAVPQPPLSSVIIKHGGAQSHGAEVQEILDNLGAAALASGVLKDPTTYQIESSGVVPKIDTSTWTVSRRVKDIFHNIMSSAGSRVSAIEAQISKTCKAMIKAISALGDRLKTGVLSFFDSAHSLFSDIIGGLTFWSSLAGVAVRIAWDRLTTFVSTNKWAVLISATTAAGLVALAVTALYHFFKDAPVTAHSEEKHDKSTRVKEERDHLTQAKKLPRRMRKGRLIEEETAEDPRTAENPIPHVSETEMPFIDKISNNVYTVMCQVGENISYGQLTMLGGTYGFTAAHVAKRWQMCKGKLRIHQCFTDGVEAKQRSVYMSPPICTYVEDRELAFVEFDSTFAPAVNIVKHFITDDDFSQLSMYGISEPRVAYRDSKGVRCITEGRLAEYHQVSGKLFNDSLCYNAPYFRTPMVIPPSSSGGLAFTGDPHRVRKIYGAHVAGSREMSYDTVITQELIADYCKKLPDLVIIPHFHLVSGEAMPPKDQAQPIGILAHGQTSGGTNKICLSPIAPHLLSQLDGPRPSTVPTLMYNQDPSGAAKRWIEQGVLPETVLDGLPTMVTPFANAYAKAPPFHFVDPEILKEAFDIDDYPVVDGRSYFMLTPEQAVFGCPEIGLPPIDLATSAGYNAEGAKTFDCYSLLGIPRRGEFQPTSFEEWDPMFRSYIVDGITALFNGDYVRFITVDSLKPERRKWTRSLFGITRLFYAAHKAHLVISRMLFGHLTVLEKETHLTSSMQVGVSAISAEWREMLIRFSRFSNVIVTDQVNFDMHQQYAIADFQARARASVLSRANLQFAPVMPWLAKYVPNVTPATVQQQFLTAVHRLTTSTCDLYHVAGSVLYRDNQVTASGVDRTSQDNTGRNKLCLRAAFIDVMREHRHILPEEWRSLEWRAIFRKCIESCLYGDDQAIGVHPIVAGRFTTYMYMCASEKLFGSKMTLPNKDPILPETPFCRLSDFELLKRGYRIQDGVFYAPLQKSVIEDSVFWNSSKKNQAAYSASTVRSALIEASAHGHAYWTWLYQALERAWRLARLPASLFTPMTYEESTALWTRL